MTRSKESIFRPLDFDEPAGRKLRLYYELHGFPTSEASVMREKFKRLGTILKTIERMAIVGDQRWLTAYTILFDALTRADIRNFKSDDRAAALDWMRE